METPGQCLKRRREERGLSVEDVSRTTKIGVAYLRAIEEDRYEVLPAEVFAVGFLRQYAASVGLDPDDIVLRYRVARKRAEANPGGPSRPGGGVGFKRAAAVLVCLLLAVAGLWSVFSRHDGEGGHQKVRAIRAPRASPREIRKAQIRHELGLDRLESAFERGQVGAPAEWGVPGSGRAEGTEKRVNVVVQSARRNWISVEMDGGPWVDRTIEPGETCAFSASRSLQLRIGHGEGVKVFYEGKVLENLGEKGAILHMSFPPRTAGREGSPWLSSPDEG